jgi:hypothetical protein
VAEDGEVNSRCDTAAIQAPVTYTTLCGIKKTLVSTQKTLSISEDDQEITVEKTKYRCALVSMGNMFQDLPQLCETVDNTKRYIYSNVIFV